MFHIRATCGMIAHMYITHIFQKVVGFNMQQSGREKCYFFFYRKLAFAISNQKGAIVSSLSASPHFRNFFIVNFY